MAKQNLAIGGDVRGLAAPPNFPATTLAPGRLAKLTAKHKALLIKRTPKGLMPGSPFKMGVAPNGMLD